MVLVLLVSGTVLAARVGARLAAAAPVYFRRTNGPEIGKVERLDEVCLLAVLSESART